MFLKSDATIMEYLAKKMAEKVKKCGIDNVKFLPTSGYYYLLK